MNVYQIRIIKVLLFFNHLTHFLKNQDPIWRFKLPWTRRSVPGSNSIVRASVTIRAVNSECGVTGGNLSSAWVVTVAMIQAAFAHRSFTQKLLTARIVNLASLHVFWTSSEVGPRNTCIYIVPGTQTTKLNILSDVISVKKNVVSTACKNKMERFLDGLISCEKKNKPDNISYA